MEVREWEKSKNANAIVSTNTSISLSLGCFCLWVFELLPLCVWCRLFALLILLPTHDSHKTFPCPFHLKAFDHFGIVLLLVIEYICSYTILSNGIPISQVLTQQLMFKTFIFDNQKSPSVKCASIIVLY